jgi:hypothetical protein
MGALLLTAGASSTFAADEPRGAQFKEQLAARFAKADVNGDGHLTREEAQQGMPRIYQHFDEIDASKNGYLTLQDIQAFMMARAAAKHGNKP